MYEEKRGEYYGFIYGGRSIEILYVYYWNKVCIIILLWKRGVMCGEGEQAPAIGAKARAEGEEGRKGGYGGYSGYKYPIYY